MQITMDLKMPYDIVIKRGLLADVGSLVAKLWEPKLVALITDAKVKTLYADMVVQSLESRGFTVHVYAMPVGEENKTLGQVEDICVFLAQTGIHRSSGLIALGGGVVGDVCGFVASTYMRGLPYIQLPTSLLAQVDSSIGGKTGVNSRIAKNLIGTFYQPKGVFIDPNTLVSLSSHLIKDGLGEIIKTGAISSGSLWEDLEHIPDLSAFLKDPISVISLSCRFKQGIVEQDERESHLRMVLNFGHTIGHGIEQMTGYQVYTHGQAVAFGMLKITEATEQMGLSQPGTYRQLKAMLEKFGLETQCPDLEKETLLSVMQKDKKKGVGKINLVILEAIRKPKIISVGLEDLHQYIGDSL